MKMPVLFRSTNRNSPVVGLKEALLRGQAPDKGLYMPEVIPRFEIGEILSLKEKPYHEVAFRVLREYCRKVISDDLLQAICREVYDYEVPLEPAGNRSFVMRLDRGPTASFKDFAARMMGRLIGHFTRQDVHPLTILTATSGDTGSAIAQAFFGVANIRIVVLFPVNEVSDRQRKQMTTLGKNVATIAIDGKFDDCQALVKRAFADPELKDLRLSSANSINIGRLLPQSCYYVYAYSRLTKDGEPIVFSVPSGNFGDLMGGVIAKRMGVPVSRFVVATNANDEVPRFFETGKYDPIVPSRVCISNAMNVGHPSNLARLVDFYGGQMDEVGAIIKAPDMERIRADFFSVSVSDEATRKTIAEAHKDAGLLLEPHGAVAWNGLQSLFKSGLLGKDALAVSIETAHPAKFPEHIKKILGIDPVLPPSLQGIENRQESFLRMEADYAGFKNFLRSEYA
ncbi:threonine synthase [bacterium CG2_30_54_10]|nr:MAG: threonine synthase [bacterium CG2_30_54_10]